MTRVDPSIWLSRLTVLKTGKAVYDQRFHLGVNIIHGENGSGKSTIADFIFFALGGDHTDWRQQASMCDFTLAEVCINGAFVTLSPDFSHPPGCTGLRGMLSSSMP